VVPMHKVGSSCFVRLAAFCAVLTWLLSLSPVAFGQSSSSPPNRKTGFEALAADAESAREAGRFDEAIGSYRGAVALRPEWEEGWWYLGTLLYDGDHFEEAIPALRRVVQLDPKVGAARAFLGLCEFETGDYADAYTHLESAKELGFADSPDAEKVALYHLGLLLNVHGEYEGATELLVGAFGPSQFTEQVKTALALALLRAPILPAQIDPSKDAIIHAAGETAVLLANRDRDGALRAFEQMLRDYPGTPYLNYRYGLALVAAARYQDAEDPLREEIRITPRSPLAWIALAEALRGLGQRDGEAAALRRSQEVASGAGDPDDSQARRYKLDRGVATKTTSSSSSDQGGQAPSALGFDEAARRADEAQRAGRAEEAAVWYQNAVKLRSTWPEGWRQLGTIQYMNGRYAEAIVSLKQSVALAAKQADTWTLLGLSEFETKDYKNALVHLERGRALGLSGNAAAVRLSRYHLALLLNRGGDFDRAIDVLIPVIGSGALADEIRFAMGMALLRIAALPEQVSEKQRELVRKTGEAGELLSESRYDRALPIFEDLVNVYPTTPFLHYAYGDALAATSMYDEALSQLREEVKLNPASELAYLRLASIDLLQHQSASALAEARKATLIAPDSSEARYLLGRSLLDEGDIPAAIHELETARRLSPNSPKVLFNLARAYARAGRTAEAQQERSEFERLNSQLPGQRGSYGDRAARGTAGEIVSPPPSN
jgi:tetratricopeptide (TPR) repeat protein